MQKLFSDLRQTRHFLNWKTIAIHFYNSISNISVRRNEFKQMCVMMYEVRRTVKSSWEKLSN